MKGFESDAAGFDEGGIIVATQQTIKGTGRMRLNALSDSVMRNRATPKTTTARSRLSRMPVSAGAADFIGSGIYKHIVRTHRAKPNRGKNACSADGWF